MIEINKLIDSFVNHAARCRSAPIVCCAQVAVEAWFHVELVPALLHLGVPVESIDFDYTYPGTKKKADLLVDAPDYTSIIELKSFVHGADANKLREWPVQLQRLRGLVESKVITQGIAFCVFIGYGPKRLLTLVDSFFAASSGRTGPMGILPNTPLRLIVASYNRHMNSHPQS